MIYKVVQRRMVLVVFFRIFEMIMFCSVVAIFDLLYDVDVHPS